MWLGFLPALRLFSLISAQQAGTSPLLFSECTFLPVDHVPIREFGDGGLLLWDELLEDFTLLCDTGVGWGLSLSLFFSSLFPQVLASVYAVEFWSEGRIKWRPLLQQLGCKRGLWEITTPLCCRRRGGTLLLSGEVWMVIVVLTFIHAEFVTDFPPNSQGISSHSFP